MLDDFFILKDGKLLDISILTEQELEELEKELEQDLDLDLELNELNLDKVKNKTKNKTRTGLEIYPRLRGGGFLDIFSSILEIGKVFFILLDIVKWLIKFIIWFVFFIIAVLKFMFVDLIFDFYNTIVLIVITIFKTPIEIVHALFAWVINGIGGWMTTIWGWDQGDLTKRDKNSNYFKGIDRNRGRKCYLTNNGKVPFSILLGTVLCPPLGVFMDLGMTGWFNIMLCTILTFMYYIPGLVYALFTIYS